MRRNSVIIIPSLNPDEKLIHYIDSLIKSGFEKIILVDDGSSEAGQKVLCEAGSMLECELLVHTVNMGKGRALKNAFNIYCQKYAQDYLGVITVDSDGQHMIQDVIKLDEAFGKYQDTLILGVRDFDEPSVPFKSRLGNKMTRHILKVFIGCANMAGAEYENRQNETACKGRHRHLAGISDTQTGLRAIPNKCIPNYLALSGERFEYETNILIEALRRRTKIHEIKIQTVYVNNNRETHFRPLADSAAIYGLIFTGFFRYIAASMSAFFVDYSVYCVLVSLLCRLPPASKIWIAAVCARMLSSLYNYIVNKTAVFKNTDKQNKTLAKYYMLCVMQTGCSAFFTWMLCSQTGISETAAKLVVDTMLFCISFQIQKNWVFKEKLCPQKEGVKGESV